MHIKLLLIEAIAEEFKEFSGKYNISTRWIGYVNYEIRFSQLGQGLSDRVVALSFYDSKIEVIFRHNSSIRFENVSLFDPDIIVRLKQMVVGFMG